MTIPGPPSTAQNHGHETPLGFDKTYERSREISPDPTSTRSHEATSARRTVGIRERQLGRAKINGLPNSESIMAFRRRQIFQSSGPGTYPCGSRNSLPVPRGDIRGFILRATKVDQRLMPPSTVQLVHYKYSSEFPLVSDGTGADGPRSRGGRRTTGTGSYRAQITYLFWMQIDPRASTG